MNNRSYKIDELKFKEIKTFLSQSKMPQEKVAKYCGVSACSVSRIKRADDYEEYLGMLKKEEQSSKEPSPSEKADGQKTMIVSYDLFRELLKQVDQLNQKQELTNNLLTAIMDAWSK